MARSAPAAALLAVMAGLLQTGASLRPIEDMSDQALAVAVARRQEPISCLPEHADNEDAAAETCGVMHFDDLKAECYADVCDSGIRHNSLPYLMEEVQRFHWEIINETTPTPVVNPGDPEKIIVLWVAVAGIEYDLLQADAELTPLFVAAVTKAISEGMDIDGEVVECHLRGAGAGSGVGLQVSHGHDSVSVRLECYVTPPQDQVDTFDAEFHGEERTMDEIIALEVGQIPGIEAVTKSHIEVATNETEEEQAAPTPAPFCSPHVSEENSLVLQQVIDVVNTTIYGSMDSSDAADRETVGRALADVEQCNANIASRSSATGDLTLLHQNAMAYQGQVNHHNNVVAMNSAANVSAWYSLSTHISMIGASPDCAPFPGAATKLAFDVYFESSAYVNWYIAQQPAYTALADAFADADDALSVALTALNVARGVLQVEYCDWKAELETACASFDTCYQSTSDHYSQTLVPRIESDVLARIEAYQAGESVIAHVKFLLCQAETLETPTVDTSRYEIEYPAVPGKETCDMSPLTSSTWDPPITCEDVGSDA